MTRRLWANEIGGGALQVGWGTLGKEDSRGIKPSV